MIIEQNISQFVQLAPTYAGEGPPDPIAAAGRKYCKRDLCRAFPFDFIDHSTGRVTQPGVSDFSYKLSEDRLYYTVLFRVSAEVSVDPLKGGVSVIRWASPSAAGSAGININRLNSIATENDGNNSESDHAGVGDPSSVNELRSVHVEYIWFLNWTDFEPPPPAASVVRHPCSLAGSERTYIDNNPFFMCILGDRLFNEPNCGTYESWK